MIALEDLIKPVTVDEAKSTIYAVLAQLGCPTTGWAIGGVVRAIVATVAIVVSAFSRVAAQVIRGGFLSLATGNWLTLHAREYFSIQRTTATFASGTLKITKTGGSIYPLGVGELIVRNAKDKTFRNTEAITLAAGDHTYYVGIQATEAGSDSTSAAGTIVTLVTSLLNVSVTNETAIVGADEEQDEPLRARCQGKVDSASPAGPKNAYDYVARSCGQGVTRTRVYGSNGTTVVVVGNASGPLTPAQLAAVDTEIQANVTPVSNTTLVVNCTTKQIAVNGTIRAYRTSLLTDSQIISLAEAAVVKWMSERPIGGDEGFVRKVKLESQIDRVDSSINNIVLDSPSADVVIQQNEAPVCSFGPFVVEWA